jgi:hypothetical protein
MQWLFIKSSVARNSNFFSRGLFSVTRRSFRI